MTTTDRIKNIGLKPDAMLHVTMLCNSVRLASSAVELVEAEAQANGFVVGLQVGGGISEQQKEQLAGLFDELATQTKAQHSAAITVTKASAVEPDSAIAVAEAELVAARNLDVSVKFIQELLADTIRDLERQISPEFRGQFYGECRGLLKAMRVGNLLDEVQRDQWSADIYRASLQAADQCSAAGEPADDSAVNQQRFQLEQLARRGIKPRAELPR